MCVFVCRVPFVEDCKQLAPVWDQLAVELEAEVYVAKVNGPKYKALQKRLHVKAYPTILYLRDGEMREYGSSRTLAQLAAFGRKTWRQTKPVPFYKAPNNWFGRMAGVVFRIPGIAEEAYKVLREEYKLSDVTILFAALMIPTFAGMCVIFAADAWVVRSAKRASAEARHRQALLAAQRQRQEAVVAAAAAGGGGGGGGGMAGVQPAAAPVYPPHPHPHHD